MKLIALLKLCVKTLNNTYNGPEGVIMCSEENQVNICIEEMNLGPVSIACSVIMSASNNMCSINKCTHLT